MYCRKCGYNMPEDSKFCERCGTKVEKSAANSVQAPCKKDNTGRVANKKKVAVLSVLGLVIIILFTIMFIVGVRENASSKEENYVEKEDKDIIVNGKYNDKDAIFENINNEKSVNKQIELFNEKYSAKNAVPYFINMDTDKDLEVVVILNEAESDNTNLASTDISIYDIQKESITCVYSNKDNSNYSLIINDGISEIIYSSELEQEGNVAKKLYYKLKLEGGMVKEDALNEEQYVDMSEGSIGIKGEADSMELTDIEMYDFTNEYVLRMSNIAKELNMRIVDIRYVYSEGKKSIYATMLPVKHDVVRRWDETISYSTYSNAYVWNIDEKGKETNLGKIVLADETDEYGDSDLNIDGFGTYKFGDIEHYYVSLSGVGYYAQYKYGFIDGEVQIIDSDLEFVQYGEDVYCVNIRSWGEWYSTTEYVEVTFEDNQYKQFCAEDIEENELIKFENYTAILEETVKEIYEIEYLSNIYEVVGIEVIDVELDNIKKSSNDKFYLTFRINAIDSYFPEYQYQTYVYYTFVDDAGVLVEEGPVNYTSKETISELDLECIK